MKRRSWLIGTGIAVTLIAGLVGGAGSQAPDTQEPLSSVWRRPLRRTIALAVSPDGQRVVAVTLTGRVVCLDGEGNPVWEKVIPGADRAAVSRLGELTAVYSVRRPRSRKVHFLDGLGRILHVSEPADPVESVTLAPGAQMAAVAAGAKITFVVLDGDGVREREVGVGAEPRQVQFGPEDTVYVACRKPDQVLRLRSSGRTVWRSGHGPVDYSISASEDGGTVAVACQPQPDQVQVSLLTAVQRPVWTTALPGRSARVRLSSRGQAVVVAYQHRLEHSRQSRYERRLAYIRGADEKPWFKGGAYSAPLSVAVDRFGDWVVALDTHVRAGSPDFRLYGRNGERLWLYSAPAHVLLASPSLDGRSIAAYRADGVLEMIRVATP